MIKGMILSLVALIVSTLGVFAQSQLVATLTHNKTITAYYGDDAFKEAYDAAENGDCITLSSGTFNGCNIVKALTVRGAGMETDDETQMAATELNLSSFSIDISALDDNTASFECLRISCDNLLMRSNEKGLSFTSCKFLGAILPKGGIIYFTHCIIQSTNPVVTSSDDAYHFTSCVMRGRGNGQNMYVTNCIYEVMSGGSTEFFPEIRNSIIYGSAQIPYNTFNSVYCDSYASESSFSHISNTTNKFVNSSSDLYEANPNGMLFSENYKVYILTDAAKTTYLGNDGTQVGIYGGANPFTCTPTNPRIKSFTLTSNNEDGTLKVKLNVK